MRKNDNQNQNWFKFYSERVNSDKYESYFRRKYGTFLNIINPLLNIGLVKEEGIGIGSVTKALGTSNTYGTDICYKMLSLCAVNLSGSIDLWKEDILSSNKIFKPNTVAVVTHGVLEHFSDKQIKSILSTYKDQVSLSIHYVPTDRYEKPSFGDERLLSPDYWKHTFKPLSIVTDNDEKDLYLIFSH